jgi:hypothetical protein
MVRVVAALAAGAAAAGVAGVAAPAPCLVAQAETASANTIGMK